MNNRLRLLIAFSFILVIGVSACSTHSTVEGGGEGNVEASLITYSDPSQGFSIGYPNNWTQDSSMTQGVKFIGSDSYMTLEFVPSSGLDAMAFAQKDAAVVSSAFADYKQLSLGASTDVKDAIILGFQSTETSLVTTKKLTTHDERYYMPLSDGRIAILTVVVPQNLYDREGIRDIALSFKLNK